jgi:hypothetical protein
MAKKRKKKSEDISSTNGVKALPLYDLVKEKNGNVHPDYCFYHREWEEERGSKKYPMMEEGVCNKINLKTLCCDSYPDPVKVIRPDNPNLGCAMSPAERNKKKVETVIKINPIKAAKRARKQGLL